MQGFFKGLGWMVERGEGEEEAVPVSEKMEKNTALFLLVYHMCLNDALIQGVSICFMLTKVQFHDWLVPIWVCCAAKRVRPTFTARVPAFPSLPLNWHLWLRRRVGYHRFPRFISWGLVPIGWSQGAFIARDGRRRSVFLLWLMRILKLYLTA